MRAAQQAAQQAAQMALVVPVAWVAAEYAEGVYHRASGHREAALGGALQRAHDDHHNHPVDASDDEYVVVIATLAIVVAFLVARRPKCPSYMRGMLDAVVLVALLFPYVSWALHAAYHDPDTILLALGRPFTDRRARHRRHHASGGRCNYGITGHVYDCIHGTLDDEYKQSVYLIDTHHPPVAARQTGAERDEDKERARGADTGEGAHQPGMTPKVARDQREDDDLHYPTDVVQVDPCRDPVVVGP